jgi:hypothetical protein
VHASDDADVVDWNSSVAVDVVLDINVEIAGRDVAVVKVVVVVLVARARDAKKKRNLSHKFYFVQPQSCGFGRDLGFLCGGQVGPCGGPSFGPPEVPCSPLSPVILLVTENFNGKNPSSF